VNAALVLKAPLASPALTGTATASNLTVATNLLIGTTNVLTALGEKATTTALDLKAPKESPALTGTATAANLTVATNLLIGTTNVLTTLNSKANTSDTYTRTQVANLFQPLITTFGSPLRCDVNILSGLSTLSIEETAALAVGNIDCSGTLTVSGNVNLTSFLPIKPWAGCEVRMSGTTVTVSQSTGYNTMTALNVIRTEAGVYTLSFPPHPYVNNFIPMLVARTADGTKFYYPTCKFISPTTTTNIVVYMRNGAALVDGDFFFATIP
jgi:hypothetical protein